MASRPVSPYIYKLGSFLSTAVAVAVKCRSDEKNVGAAACLCCKYNERLSKMSFTHAAPTFASRCQLSPADGSLAY